MHKKTKKTLKHSPYNNLKGKLAEKGLKQKDLAILLGLSPVTINQKINGYLEFTYTEVEQISDYLKSNIADLFFTQKVS